MKGKLFLITVLVALILSGWMPGAPVRTAQAASTTPLNLLVNNKTGETVQLNLVGPQNYTFTVQPGKSTQQVLAGKYKYTYQACQGKKTGTFTISKNGKQLTLAACSKNQKQKSKEVKVNISNQTGGTVWLTLTGPAAYNFTVQPGTSAIWVIKGKYNYSAYGCGGAASSGTRKLRSGLTWTWYCY
jgi:hypothetical protein